MWEESTMRTRTTLMVAGLAALALAGAGCSGGDSEELLRPGRDQFHTGTCYDAAPAILAVGDLAIRLRGATEVSTVDRATLDTGQKELRKLRTSAELEQPVKDLVTAIGFIRLRMDSNTFAAPLMDDLLTAEQEVVRRCIKT
jgi:hypothetical protein